MTSPAIQITGLHKSFGRQAVLRGIDLTVPKGGVFALLGPNGAGKTTLINILSTLVVPDSGTALVAGRNVMTERNAVKSAISLTGQFAAVDEVLTCEENLIMIGRLYGLSASQAKTRANELIIQFDLTAAAKKRVKTYSGGMRRRLDLAISLIVPRPIIFLDEPTTGLDTHSRRTLWDIILQLAGQGITIFLTTQYLEEADQLADTIAVIADGRIVASGTPEQLKARIGGEQLELLSDKDEVLCTVPTSGQIHDVQRALNELAASFPSDVRVNLRRPSMDDVFVALTSHKMEDTHV
ncbi:ATP-binding cassette domain-containing protein [Paenibacillus sp. GCM10027626]|uniref:ATP-binding cassette domain-containing protein n=1 Tax=Paenibacillus sp. GCM10027626 TaxID=3273411 RepID=UPI003642FB71